MSFVVLVRQHRECTRILGYSVKLDKHVLCFYVLNDGKNGEKVNDSQTLFQVLFCLNVSTESSHVYLLLKRLTCFMFLSFFKKMKEMMVKGRGEKSFPNSVLNSYIQFITVFTTHAKGSLQNKSLTNSYFFNTLQAKFFLVSKYFGGRCAKLQTNRQQMGSFGSFRKLGRREKILLFCSDQINVFHSATGKRLEPRSWFLKTSINLILD